MTSMILNPALRGAGKPEVALVPGLRKQDFGLMQYLASMFGAPHTGDELGKTAAGYVSGSVNPVIDNLTAEATRQVQQGSKAIQGVYDNYAGRLGKVGDTVRSDNANAVGIEQRSGDALRSYLENAGATTAGDVGKPFASEPAGSALANAGAAASAGVGGLGKGVAGESAARSYTGLSDINARGRAAQTFADELPGIARFEGLQSLGDFTGTVQGGLKTKTDALLAQIPGMTADITDRLTGREDANRQNKASALGSFLTSALDRNTQAAIAKAGIAKDTSSKAIDWTNQLGYKTDANGNPVYDSSGNLIPTETSTYHANAKADQAAADRKTALANLSTARQTAIQTVRTVAAAGLHPKPVAQQVPEVVAGIKTGRFVTKKVMPPAASYEQVVKLAMAQPEVTVLARRFALKPDELRKVVEEGLAAAGYVKPGARAAADVAPSMPDTQPNVPGVLRHP